MHPVFEGRTWSLEIPPPWRATQSEGIIQISQPEGVGALHISFARKRGGPVSKEEILEQIGATAPVGTDVETSVLGEFSGQSAEYVDWHTDHFWKRWFVSNRSDLLFITYTCQRGDEDLEIPGVLDLLATLRTRA